MRRIINVLFGLDETVNAALGGSPRETISGSVGRAAKAGKTWGLVFQTIINWLMRNPQHCQHAADVEARMIIPGN